MKYLKEFWRIIKSYLPFSKLVINLCIYVLVTFVLQTVVFNNSILDCMIIILFCLLVDVIGALLSPVVLFYKVRRQTKKLLSQKLPNNFQLKSFEFDCEGMYFWDVEKINKLKVQNEKSISPSA